MRTEHSEQTLRSEAQKVLAKLLMIKANSPDRAMVTMAGNLSAITVVFRSDRPEYVSIMNMVRDDLRSAYQSISGQIIQVYGGEPLAPIDLALGDVDK